MTGVTTFFGGFLFCISVHAVLIPLSPILRVLVPPTGIGRLAYSYGYHGRRHCKISIVLGYTGTVGCVVPFCSAVGTF
jgi:hypothetical protein